VAYGSGYAPQTQLYSVEAAGRQAAQLTFGNEPLSNVRPSPDGRTFAFEHGGSIWTMRPDGRAQRVLVRNGTQATWSPDSRSIAYVAVAGGRRLGIRSIRLDGTGGRWLTHGDVETPAW